MGSARGCGANKKSILEENREKDKRNRLMLSRPGGTKATLLCADTSGHF
jgi:hypothetical protein